MAHPERTTRDRAVIDRILNASQVLRVALAVDGEATIFPLAFGYDGQTVYFHTARESGKLEMFERKPRVCVEVEHGVRLLRDDPNPCQWGFAYESVIGRGQVEELLQPAEKERGLREIVRHYAGVEVPVATEDVARVRVWRVKLEAATARRAHVDEAAPSSEDRAA